MLRKTIWSLAGILLIALAGLLGYQRLQANIKFNGTELNPPAPAADFVLNSNQGNIRLSDFRGKTVLLFFGYSSCQDVCPLTLAKLAQAIQQMGTNAKDYQVIFISVDPQRDTPQKLEQYIYTFDPTFIGATGTPDTIASVAKSYGIFYQKTDIQSFTSYQVTHTADVLVIDPQGRWRLLWPEEMGTAEMVQDLKLLMRR